MYWNEPLSRRRLGVLGLCDNSLRELFNDDLFWGAGVRMAGAFTGGVVLARLHRLTPIAWRAVQGQIADVALLVIVVNFAVDLVYARLDPRISAEG